MPFGDEKVTQFSGFPPTSVSYIKVVVRACLGAYFVAHVFKYLAQKFLFPGDLHDDAFLFS